MPQSSSKPEHPFLSHLAVLLSIYDLDPNPRGSAGTPPIPLPGYEGPRDLHIDAIERSLAKIAHRMRLAEKKLGAVHPWTPPRDVEYDTDLEGDYLNGIPIVRRPSHDLIGDPFDQAPDSSHLRVTKAAGAPSPMQISQEGLQHVSDPTHFQRFGNPDGSSTVSSPASTRPSPYHCSTCRRPVPLSVITSSVDGHIVSNAGSLPSSAGSPLVVPPGLLSAAAFESGMSTVEELRLLKAQVSDVARVCKAVVDGDLTQKITVPVQGPVMVQLKDVINTMVDRLGQFAKEVTQVSVEVGKEGKLGGQARIEDIQGTWQEITSVVNTLAANLTAQARSIAIVTTAVARGDLSQMVEIDAKGEVQELKNTVNRMVIQLRAFATEVTQVTLEVGSQGILGGSAMIENLEGVWQGLAHNVNRMCWSFTSQVRSIAAVTTAVAKGDLTQRVEVEVEGEMATLKDTVNSMVAQLGTFTSEVTRVALEVGTEGILGGQATVEGAQGTWADLATNVNKLAANLTNQVRSIAEVTNAVAHGDLSRSVTLDAHGEMLDLRNTVNSMVSRLLVVANEVIRVSHEVGTEGDLGGRAVMPSFEGTWKEMTDSVNLMAWSQTIQVRSIAEVTTAVARGDLTKRINIDVRGEMLALKETVNFMTESLSACATEVTRVTKEVGTDGILGGQASVDNVSGIWKDLTDNVNTMAANLTVQTQSVAIATRAVANDGLTRKVEGVPVSGEMLDLVKTINGTKSDLFPSNPP